MTADDSCFSQRLIDKTGLPTRTTGPWPILTASSCDTSVVP